MGGGRVARASDAGLHPRAGAAAERAIMTTTHDGQPPIDDAIVSRLLGFRPLHSRMLRWVTRTMPWVMLGVVAGLLVTRASDPMFLTALLAAGVAGLLFGILLGNVPEILDQLWKRGVVQVRKEDNCPTTERSPTQTGFTGRVALYLGSRLRQRFATQAKGAVQDQELGPAYLAFIDRVEQYLNSRLSWLCGLFIAGLMFLSFPARFSSGPDWWRHPRAVAVRSGGVWSLGVSRLGGASAPRRLRPRATPVAHRRGRSHGFPAWCEVRPRPPAAASRP